MAEANPEPQIPDDEEAELAKQIGVADANPEPQIPDDEDSELAKQIGVAEANPEPQIPDDEEAELAKKIGVADANPEPQIPDDEDSELAKQIGVAEANPEPQIPDDEEAELAKQIGVAEVNPEPQIPDDDAKLAGVAQELSNKDSETDKASSKTSIDIMLFAEELVAYILRKLKHDWKGEMGSRQEPESAVKQRFSRVIGKAVLDIMSYHMTEIVDTSKNLESKKIVEKDQFQEKMSKTAECYLETGYNPVHFLTMAASFIGVAEIFFSKGKREMADACALVLADSLNRCISKEEFNETEDWETLLDIAEDISDNYNMWNKPRFVLPFWDE